jgi:hypothetical protein
MDVTNKLLQQRNQPSKLANNPPKKCASISRLLWQTFSNFPWLNSRVINENVLGFLQP